MSGLKDKCAGKRTMGLRVVVVALLALVGCSDDTSFVGELGGGGPDLASVPAGPRPGPGASTRMTPGVRAQYIASVQNSAGPEYDFEELSSSAVARTPSQGLVAVLTDGALRVEPTSATADWSLQLRWTGIGRGDDIKPVAAPNGRPTVEGNRATYHRTDKSREWYLNGPLGIEQGFDVGDRPRGDRDALVVELTVGGSLEPTMGADSTQLLLRNPRSGAAVRYGEFLAHDAAGRRLTTSMTMKPACDRSAYLIARGSAKLIAGVGQTDRDGVSQADRGRDDVGVGRGRPS